jgi:6,7-dimethyl-8-ribityllumazine synthase
MPKSKILVVWSNYYGELAEQQLESCVQLLKQSEYAYTIETVAAGTYEIPAVMQYYHRNEPFDGYIPLSLLLKGSTDHYEFIWEHVKECFIRFALDGLLLGNGIISAPSPEILGERVANGERVKEAFLAIDYLIKFKTKQFKNSISDL